MEIFFLLFFLFSLQCTYSISCVCICASDTTSLTCSTLISYYCINHHHFTFELIYFFLCFYFGKCNFENASPFFFVSIFISKTNFIPFKQKKLSELVKNTMDFEKKNVFFFWMSLSLHQLNSKFGKFRLIFISSSCNIVSF